VKTSLNSNIYFQFRLIVFARIKIELHSINKGVTQKMKKFLSLLFLIAAIALFLVACGSSKDINVTLDKKHEPFPDYVLNSSVLVQETYAMVSNYPEVVAGVPCYCGCFASDGHKSNLDCFIDQFGEDNSVTGWDSMGIA
jgi:hypothetical protein